MALYKIPTLWALLYCLVLSTSQVDAGVMPVKNLPDYNGTYFGTPGTGSYGSIVYTTLYRDNYYRTSGCAGEGCGSHAGVDIGVSSGTSVYAALSGKIVVAKCEQDPKDLKSSYGGLVIIEADSPYTSGTKVYLVYAHLDVWNMYSKGSTIRQGDLIGKSGGNPTTGICPGGSMGTHLHFQVDKNPPDPTTGRPWGIKRVDSTKSTETADTSFTVSKYTHNPIPFVTGKAYYFSFDEDRDTELWGMKDASLYGVYNRSLWIDTTSTKKVSVGRSTNTFGKENGCEGSGGYACSRDIALDADVFKKLYIELNFSCTNGGVLISFRKSDNSLVPISLTYTNKSAIYDLSKAPGWNGMIKDFVLQPSNGCTLSNQSGIEHYINAVSFGK